jgi:hypothetical protein
MVDTVDSCGVGLRFATPTARMGLATAGVAIRQVSLPRGHGIFGERSKVESRDMATRQTFCGGEVYKSRGRLIPESLQLASDTEMSAS